MAGWPKARRYAIALMFCAKIVITEWFILGSTGLYDLAVSW